MNDKELTVIITEDNRDDAIFLQETFSELMILNSNFSKINTILTKTVKETCDYLQNQNKNKIDLLILDLNLPDCKGLATIEKFQTYLNQLPILILTGLIDEQIAIKAVKMGIQDYLIKDQIKPEIIGRSISYALERFKFIQALRESEERYRILFDEASDAIVIIEQDNHGNFSHIIEINTILLQIINRSKEEVLALLPENLFDSSNDLNYIDLITKIKNNHQFLFETRLITKDRKLIPVEINAHLIKYFSKNNILMIIRDITNRKKVENTIAFDHSLMDLLDNIVKIPKGDQEVQKK